MMLFAIAFLGFTKTSSSVMPQASPMITAAHEYHTWMMRDMSNASVLSLASMSLTANELNADVISGGASTPFQGDNPCIVYCQAEFNLDEPSCQDSLCTVFADLVTYRVFKSERSHSYVEFHYQAGPHLLLLPSLYRPPIFPIS